MKYLVDQIVAVLLLVLLAPFLLVVALIIWTSDRGPAIFSQKRLGILGSEFKVHKFRTMIINADDYLNDDGIVMAPRVTSIGKLLRFLSIDELPQLLNIVRGEMSFIGPRPALLEHFPRYTEEQKGRLRMRPGITGLAQVNGRNTLKWSERIRYDLEYIELYSILLDAKILLKTIGVVFLRRGVVMDRNSDQVDDLRKVPESSGKQ